MRRNWLFSLTLLVCFSTISAVQAQERPVLERVWSQEAPEWVDPVTTRLSLYSAQGGRLVLLDSRQRPLQQEQGQPLWLVHVWQMENEDELPDQLFYTRFTPERGAGIERLLRVTPGTDVRLTLVQEQGQWLWKPLSDIPIDINNMVMKDEAGSELFAWMSTTAIDQDLAAFWTQLEEAGMSAPTEADLAADLQVRGFVLMGEGLYAEALLLLKESYAIHATPELLDRIGRLERYLDLQVQ